MYDSGLLEMVASETGTREVERVAAHTAKRIKLAMLGDDRGHVIIHNVADRALMVDNRDYLAHAIPNLPAFTNFGGGHLFSLRCFFVGRIKLAYN
jgi:uncharacterized protein (AIM24 family)